MNQALGFLLFQDSQQNCALHNKQSGSNFENSKKKAILLKKTLLFIDQKEYFE